MNTHDPAVLYELRQRELFSFSSQGEDGWSICLLPLDLLPYTELSLDSSFLLDIYL